MKTVSYSSSARAALKKHRNVAKRIMDKIDAYAETGVGDVKKWDDITRLRIADFRVIFQETETEILVTAIGPRGSIYE